ncbi:MAG: putative ABC transporter ATP-binding protein [Lentisphaerae bacterium ADurb.BinA184]|nr:MAG: putative ABC transporter ATP-binding protein [Lentisphaerae bacterium ADurb.BinA184]
MNGKGGQLPQQELSHGQVIRRLLGLAWRYRGGCIRAVVLQVVLLGIGVISLGLTGVGIDYIRLQVDAGAPSPHWPLGLTPPAGWGPLGVVLALSGAVVGLALVRAVLTYHYSLGVARLVQQGIVVDLRARVYDKLQRLSFRFFDDNACGTLINRVTGDVQSVRLFVDGVVIQTTILVVSVVVYGAYMVRIHVPLTLACLAGLPLIWLASTVFSRLVRPAYLRSRELADDLVLGLSESIQGMHVIKGFTREAEQRASFAAANRAVREQKRRIFWLVTCYAPGVELLSQCNLMVLLGYGGWLVIHGRLPLGTGLVVFLGLLQRFSAQINTVTAITDNVQQSLAAARRVFEILDTPPEVQSPARAIRRPTLEGHIRFEHVSFEYDLGEPVLRDICFEARPGQCIGILGTTGAGKSTLLSLIPRFYDVTGGQLLVDGVDVRRLSLEDLRRQVGLVFQESFLFSNTVAANIAFGHPAATRAQVEQAARQACAHDFVSRLPRGYDTVLGEGGADLSGGQRQRLAIARAILLSPAILLLDDPTAAVDAETEGEILDAIDSARQGRTTFLVTHRISVLRRADLIVVLHRGRVVQTGTHDQLMRVKGHYRHTARLQAGEGTAMPEPAAGGAP